MQRENEGVADPEVELSCRIIQLYGSLSETEMILEEPEVGMPCCVNEGSEWYRAIVCDNTDAAKLVVRYVDYGSMDGSMIVVSVDRSVNVVSVDGSVTVVS